MFIEALHNLSLASLLDTLVSLSSAFVCGGIIGFERQYCQRTAGLRTNVLVAVGAAIFVDMANRLDGHGGAVRVVSYVVSGIGFLGAGVIMREQGNVRGLNTAATLWCSAAVGACCGGDLILEAGMGTIFILMANTLLRPVVSLINRQPLDVTAVETTTTIYVIADRARQEEALKFLTDRLNASNHLPREVKTHACGDDQVEIEVILSAIAVDGGKLDKFVTELSSLEGIARAFWSPTLQE